MIYLQNDEERYFKYNITSKVSLKMFFEETVNKTRFLNVISSICKAFEMCGEYMIEDKSIVLDAEHIFCGRSSAKAELVCLPVLKEGGANVNVVNFFKLLLMSTQFDPTENCDYIAKLLNSLNKSDKMSFADIRKHCGRASRQCSRRRGQACYERNERSADSFRSSADHANCSNAECSKCSVSSKYPEYPEYPAYSSSEYAET